MPSLTRRDLCHSLPLLPMLASLPLHGQAATSTAATAEKKNCTEPLLSKCEAFPLEGLPVRYSSTGAPTHQILEGRIPDSEVIELHETTLDPGQAPHPPHKHPHAELLMMRQGTIEFVSDSAPVRVTAGGAAYCAPNQMHGFRNVGEGQAVYFVLKIGEQPVCQK